jgi:hypothetical protein
VFLNRIVYKLSEKIVEGKRLIRIARNVLHYLYLLEFILL